MKKIISIVLIIASVLTLFCSCSGKPVECGDYTYVVLEDDTAKITKYNGTENVIELKIPESLDDYTVTVIGKEAFKDVQNITNITTPDTLIKIEEYAFANSSIKRAYLNRSQLLTEIGEYAFSECKNLIQTDFPRSLQVIGNYAFYYCEKLKFVHFRADDVNIAEFAFDACPKAEFRIKSDFAKVKKYAEDYGFKFVLTDNR